MLRNHLASKSPLLVSKLERNNSLRDDDDLKQQYNSDEDMETFEAQIKEATNALLTAGKCTLRAVCVLFHLVDQVSLCHVFLDLKACDSINQGSTQLSVESASRRSSSTRESSGNRERRQSGPYLIMHGGGEQIWRVLAINL